MKNLLSLTPATLALVAACAFCMSTPSMSLAAKSHASLTVTTKSGLKYTDIKVGHGPLPHTGQTVTVDYIGTLTNGTKFDASEDHGQPFQFTLGVGQVIKGWDEGVKTMRVGGERKLIVPPTLGYGAAGAGGVIPPNATLIFDVKLLAIH